MLLDVLSSASVPALVPALIRKERVVVQGMAKALRVLLDRWGCCEKKERVRGNFSLHREPLVILLYYETLRWRQSYHCGNNPATNTYKIAC